MEASTNGRYQGAGLLIPNVVTEKDFPETHKTWRESVGKYLQF